MSKSPELSRNYGAPRGDDGFKIVRRAYGDWSWAEGTRAIAPILPDHVGEAIDACCKRRGIKGEFYLKEPITIDGVTFA